MHIYILCGPSGSGKTFLSKEICDKRTGACNVPSCTTRKKRDGEGPRDYNFVNQEEFIDIRESGGFVEECEVYGNLYGLRFSDLDNAINNRLNPILIMDQNGVRTIKKLYANAIGVLITSKVDDIKNRLEKRPGVPTDSSRIATDSEYMSRVEHDLYDLVLENDGSYSFVDEFLSFYNEKLVI